MDISNAIVVGGGIGGLTVACALARRGVAVTLLERSSRIAEVGAGLQVSPNGLAVLSALGLEAPLRARGAVQARAIKLHDYIKMDPVARLDLTRLEPDQRYYFAHRADLIDVLATAARRENVTIELDASVTSLRPGTLPQVQMADGSTRRAEVVIAADGIHSVGRGVLNDAQKAAFTGQVAWRATIPNLLQHPDEAHVTMAPGRHLVSYPVRAGRLVNLVAVEERSDWAAEGWQHEDDPAHLQRAFAAFRGRAAGMIAAVDHTTLWGLHRHPVAACWQRDGVALLGDAAHPTLPFLAQGANLALEDAWVLAEMIATRPRDTALSDYQNARQARVRRVIKAAQGNAARYHLRHGLLRRGAHLGLNIVSRLAPGQMMAAYDWLYRHDVTAGVGR